MKRVVWTVFLVFVVASSAMAATNADTRAIKNGETIESLSAAKDEWLFFRIDVPENVLKLDVEIDFPDYAVPSLVGDADLYTRWGEKPTRDQYDTRPYLPGSKENSSFYFPSAGTLYIGLHGYSDFQVVSLSVKYAVMIKNGETVPNLSGTRDEWQYFALLLPYGVEDVNIETFGGTGEFDLYRNYVDDESDADPQKNEWPVQRDSHCTMVQNNGSVPQECNYHAPSTYEIPLSGVLYIGIRGRGDYSGVALTANYNATLPNNHTARLLSAEKDQWLWFSIEVPDGASNLDVVTKSEQDPPTGDADLYVRFGERPTRTEYDDRPYVSGSNESVHYDSPPKGVVYIGLNAYSAFDSVMLTATYDLSIEKGKTVYVDKRPRDWFYYTIDVPENTSNLTVDVASSGKNEDYYIKTRFGSRPTFQSDGQECVPVELPDGIRCTYKNPPAGKLYIGGVSQKRYLDGSLTVNWE